MDRETGESYTKRINAKNIRKDNMSRKSEKDKVIEVEGSERKDSLSLKLEEVVLSTWNVRETFYENVLK